MPVICNPGVRILLALASKVIAVPTFTLFMCYVYTNAHFLSATLSDDHEQSFQVFLTECRSKAIFIIVGST